ncbi:MAG: hypothetical protein HUJ25_05155 [Crocinitomicaceae bacterium]|nr:hypothetical protein [Crocinitomicaceae bacterium]
MVLILSALFTMLSAVVFAQPPGGGPPGGGGGGDPPCWDPECIPIDGGIVFLIAAGTLLGIRMIYNHRIESRTE